MIFELNDPLFLPHLGCHLKLELAQGEILVLVGDNGIGKSTLLHRFHDSLNSAMSAMSEQKSLECFFDRKLSTFRELFISSKPPGLNLDFFHSFWSDFGLNSKLERKMSHLSGGELQALKLGLTLSKNCDYYFLDEPTQFLDSEKRAILLKKIQSLVSFHRSILITEHNKDWIPSGWKVVELIIENSFLVKGKEWTT